MSTLSTHSVETVSLVCSKTMRNAHEICIKVNDNMVLQEIILLHCAESLDVNSQVLRVAFKQSCRIAKCGLVMSKIATTARVHYVNATSFSFPRPSLTAHSLTLRQMSGQAPHFYLSTVDKAFTVAIPRL